jgi:hypothetical protein
MVVRQGWEGWLVIVIVCIGLIGSAAVGIRLLVTPLTAFAERQLDASSAAEAAQAGGETVLLTACTAPGAEQHCTATFADGQTRTLQWMRVATGSAPLTNGTHVIARRPALLQYGKLGGGAYFVWS